MFGAKARAPTMVTDSTYPDISIPDTAISQFVCERHAAYADKPALIDGSTDRVITYGGTARRRGDGWRPACASSASTAGTSWPCSGRTRRTTSRCSTASRRPGAAITSLNVIHNVAELSYQLIDSGARMLVLACEPTPALLAAARKAQDHPSSAPRATCGPAGIAHVGRVSCRRPSMRRPTWRRLPTPTRPSDVPMGVMVTHRNLVANLIQTAERRPDRVGRGRGQPDAVLPAVRHGGREHGACTRARRW